MPYIPITIIGRRDKPANAMMSLVRMESHGNILADLNITQIIPDFCNLNQNFKPNVCS